MNRFPSIVSTPSNYTNTHPDLSQLTRPEPLEPPGGLMQRSIGRPGQHRPRSSVDLRALNSFGVPRLTPSSEEGLTGRGDSSNTRSTDLNELRLITQHVYEDSRLYHGTNTSSKNSIRTHGFDANKKVDGNVASAEALGLPPPPPNVRARAANRHYFEKQKFLGEVFACITGGESDCALVRTIGVASEIGLQTDPDSLGKMTPHSIPPEYVLSSKKQPSGDNAAIFQRELQRAGVNVSTEDAGQLLNDVQSDSDDDCGRSRGVLNTIRSVGPRMNAESIE